MKNLLKILWREQKGQDLREYALLLGLLALGPLRVLEQSNVPRLRSKCVAESPSTDTEVRITFFSRSSKHSGPHTMSTQK